MGLKHLDVAVGVLCDAEGRVLLARRPEGKPLAGYLEFPGGKIGHGELPQDALVRELREELDVAVISGDLSPLIRLHHTYPDFTVDVHAYTLERWRGDPAGAEGQALGWEPLANLLALPLLPANRPLVNALRLPDILKVTPMLSAGSIHGFAGTLKRALSEGEDSAGIVVRTDGRTTLELLHEELGPLLRAGRCMTLANTGDVDLPPGYSGLHLPARAMASISERPDGVAWVGASVHDVEQARTARSLGLDYVIVGHINATSSHPCRPPMGWDEFRRIACEAGLPAYAIGGVTPDDLARARRYWGRGVAGIRAFWPEAA